MPFDPSTCTSEWPWELQNFELDESALDLTIQDDSFELKEPEVFPATELPTDFGNDSNFCNPFFPSLRRLSNAWNPPDDKPTAVVHTCPVCSSEINSKISDHVSECYLNHNAGTTKQMDTYTTVNLVQQLRTMIVEMDVIERINLSESLTRLARGIERSDSDFAALSLLFGKKPSQTAVVPEATPNQASSQIQCLSPILPPLESNVENHKVDLNIQTEFSSKEFSKDFPKDFPKEKFVSFSSCTTPVTFSHTGDLDENAFTLPQASVGMPTIRHLKRGRDENPIIQAIPFSPRSKMLCV